MLLIAPRLGKVEGPLVTTTFCPAASVVLLLLSCSSAALPPPLTATQARLLTLFDDSLRLTHFDSLRLPSTPFDSLRQARLLTLFQVIDADEGGSISRHEFLEIGSLANLGRAELGRAFDHAVTNDRRRTARTPGGTIELTYSQFTRLIENLDDAMLSKVQLSAPPAHSHPRATPMLPPCYPRANHGWARPISQRQIRAILPGLVEKKDGKDSLLVFDDGRQQLWRLVPGGRTLMRKAVTKRDGSALGTVDSMVM